MTPAQQKIKRWREDPVYFVTDCLKVESIDPWQLEALRSFPSQDQDKRRMSFQACAGPGKSALLAWCGWNFLSCYAGRGQHPKAAAVSITAKNLEDNLWPELSKWQSRSEFLKKAFAWTKTRIYAVDHPETWFLSARSFAKTANAEEQGRTLSGLHSDFVLALIDESGDIPLAVLKAAEQALASCKWGKILQAGNPTSHDGILYAASTQLRHLWNVIRITGDPDDPDRSSRIDIAWAREQIATYGRNNPWVMAYILGQFPPNSINSLLGPDEVADAMKRAPKASDYEHTQKRLGIDVARFGSDRTVIIPRQGLMAYESVEMRGARTNDIVGRILKAKVDWGSEMEFVDGTGGYGAGVVDGLLQAGANPHEINFAGKAIDPRYFNKRSEIHFLLAEWVKRGGALPNDPVLARELTAPTYTFQQGKLRLEEKEMIKGRLGFSPDIADSLALTFAMPDMPAALSLEGRMNQNGRVLSDYDPFDEKRM